MRRYTTILLTTARLSDPRDRATAAIVVMMIVLFAIGSAVAHRRQAQPESLAPIVQQRPIVILQTTTPPPIAPTPLPVVVYIAAPTAEPQIIYIESVPPQAPAARPDDAHDGQRTGARPEDGPAPEAWHPPMAPPACQPGWRPPLVCTQP
jgi:hypothetical protein